MTATDPAQVIAEAAAAAWKVKYGSIDWIIVSAQLENARDAVAALEAAGLTVVPAGTLRIEWAHGNAAVRKVAWSEQAARRAIGSGSGPLWTRTVHVGEWERVNDGE